MTKEFELARLHMVRAAKHDEIDHVRGYAWAHRIYPFNPSNLEQAFKDDFTIRSETTEEILRAIDDGWTQKKLITFYNLEDLRDEHRLDRMDIYHVCRLAFLDRRFDDSIWKALTVAGSGPIESQGLADPFDMERDIDY
jgi:hypothetical protein